MGTDAKSMPRWRGRRQRLMVIDGTGGRLTLLVIPHITTPALGLMVLRLAANMPISGARQAGRVFETADRIVRAAHAESAVWTGATLDARVETTPTRDL